jgi:hypothetical protein
LKKDQLDHLEMQCCGALWADVTKDSSEFSGKVIHTVKYADDLGLLAKEETGYRA